MPNKIFDNVQRAIFEIKSAIKSNEDIRKMLFIDSKNALSQTAPSISEVEPHIIVAAVFDITEPPFDKNTIMTVVLNKVKYDSDAVLLNGMIKINVLTRSELWELNDDKIRPLEIANNVVKLLDNRKVSASHKLYFTHMDIAILNENVSGYSVVFSLEEGSGLDEQF